MKVGEVMTRDVEPVPAGLTVQEAAIRMAEADVGAVLVGTRAKLEGVLTDRDIILRAVVEGLDPKAVRVGEVMSSTLFTCSEDDAAADAFRAMSEHQVRRLPVLGADGRLVGILTLGDLARREDDPRRSSEALREIAEPHRGRSAGPAAPDVE